MGEAALKLVDEELLEGVVRTRTRAQIRIDTLSDDNFWMGFSDDVGEGGVFFATHTTLPLGSLLSVELELSTEEEPIVVLADVWWTRPYSRDLDVAPGLGLKFVALDRVAKEKIRSFCERVRDPLFYEED